ncbi:MAG TPA: HAMP domain-containing sensor histidine kinase, partial [Burkholderiaceae bacterium]|nr:HAMP domain-containing sensor histidine kinase [Burkholderiaceae bacterium]
GCWSVFRLNGRDGQQRVVSANGSAFFDDTGRLQQFVGVLQDITELTRQRAQAEQRALFAEQMVGIVSHDLRNPLSAILTSAHVLRRVRLPPRHAPVLERIVSATNRAQRLIDDLLDFTQARVGSGIRIVPRTVDLHALVAATVEELAAAFAGRSLQHRRHGDGDCVADGDRLSQLIGNLVANAMAYGAEEQPVTVTSGVERDTYSIAVHNFGAPIPLALRPRLFEPMARGAGDGADTRSVGLGLFIVREIVQAHGGRIDVESDADRGTVFTVVCPRQRAGSDPARAG